MVALVPTPAGPRGLGVHGRGSHFGMSLADVPCFTCETVADIICWSFQSSEGLMGYPMFSDDGRPGEPCKVG